MIFDFRRYNTQHEPLRIHGDIIEQVYEYNTWEQSLMISYVGEKNCLKIQKKTNQRMFFLRKLKKFHVDRTILSLFYQSIIQSVMTFNRINCTFGNLTKEQKGKMDRTRKTAQRVIGSELIPAQSLYDERVLRKVQGIMADATHPLNACYRFNRSGIRLCPPLTRHACFRQSFIPNSIHLFNATVRR